MTGIFIVAFYTLFWGSCWIISGLFKYKKAKNPLRRRKWVCFWMLMTPMYFHALELVFLFNECSNSPVYFPEEKIERPNILITNDGSLRNIGESFRTANKFDYLISPTGLGDDTINFNIGRTQFTDYVVYKDVLEESKSDESIVTGQERLEILENANFAFYSNIERNWDFVWHEMFIYDYKNKQKIAGFKTISQSISADSIRNFVTLIRMPECTYNHGKYKSRDLYMKFLIESTFTKGND